MCKCHNLGGAGQGALAAFYAVGVHVAGDVAARVVWR